jgi:hypothetical protein
LQPSTDTEWELWHAAYGSAGWRTENGGRIQNVSSDPGFYRKIPNRNQQCSADPTVTLCEGLWGTPAHIPNLPGLMTLAQLESGQVDHALVAVMPNNAASVWSYPAQGTDGTGNAVIAEGTRFRLDPTLNIDAWFAGLRGGDGQQRPIAPIEFIIAKTLQIYGAVVNNTSAAVGFLTENWTSTGNNIFSGANGLFGGLTPATFMPDLPWEHMQFPQMNMCYSTQSGSSLYQTPCGAPAPISLDPSAPAGCTVAARRMLNVSPQPGDTTPLSIRITSPTWKRMSLTQIPFNAVAYDPADGVREVDFLVDGQVRYVATYPVCTQGQMQYAMGGVNGFWDARTEPFGTHVLTVTAYDYDGNQSSASVTVQVGVS